MLRFDLVPHADVGEAVRVVRRVHAALVVRQRQDRRAPAHRAHAVVRVERQPRVVAELRPRKTIGPILDIAGVPDAREVRLGERRGRRAAPPRARSNDTFSVTANSFISTPRTATSPAPRYRRCFARPRISGAESHATCTNQCLRFGSPTRRGCPHQTPIALTVSMLSARSARLRMITTDRPGINSRAARRTLESSRGTRPSCCRQRREDVRGRRAAGDELELPQRGDRGRDVCRIRARSSSPSASCRATRARRRPRARSATRSTRRRPCSRRAVPRPRPIASTVRRSRHLSLRARRGEAHTTNAGHGATNSPDAPKSVLHRPAASS